MKEQINRNNSYTPFGDTLSTSAGETARLGFIGQEQDIEHGYFNMGARYYDPEIGRFLSVDPLFEQFAEQTPYNYCFNSPLINSDASGLSPDKEKKRDQMHATEIDLFAFNQSSVMLNQSRYESSRNPSYLEMMLASFEKKQYYMSILGEEYYNNFFGGGGGSSKGGRTGNSENGKNGTSSYKYGNKTFKSRSEFAEYLKENNSGGQYNSMTVDEIEDLLEEKETVGYVTETVEVVGDIDDTISFFKLLLDLSKKGNNRKEQAENILIGSYYFVNDSRHFQGDLDINFNGGQAISLKLTNQNALGVTVRLQNTSHRYTEKNFLGIEIEHYLGKPCSFIMLPLSERNFYYDMFGDTPIGWSFSISSMSNAAFITIDIYEIKFK
jgi:RHS repeat-associated protein